MSANVTAPVILRELESGPKTFRMLIERTGISRGTMSANLAALKKSGDVVVGTFETPWVYALAGESRTLRDEARAISYITRSGVRVRATANRVTGIVQSESAAMLLLTDDLEVFAIDPEGPRAKKVSAHNPQWIVGTYRQGCDAIRIAQDLREAAQPWRAA